MKSILVITATLALSVQSFGQSEVVSLLENSAKNPSTLISEAEIQKIMCDEGLAISGHMGRMGFIIRGLTELVQNLILGENLEEIKTKVMTESQVLRTHLTAVLPKTPNKIKNINKEKVQQNKIIFQRYLVKMISYTIDLEAELLNKPVMPDGVEAQRIKIANLIIKIEETVDEAHNLFRF